MCVRGGAETLSVSVTTVLPAQPAQGQTTFVPLGGDGRSAPLGCYFCRTEVDGDASGGTAAITIEFDTRYTNLVAYANLVIKADAAAGDFTISLSNTNLVSTPATSVIVGTIPQIATGVSTENSAFLWYPPPLYHQGEGIIFMKVLNVGVLETYELIVEVLCFDIDVRRLTPLPLLQLNVPGVSAPAAI